MFEKKEFPILEFDSNPISKIEPSNLLAKRDVPEYCVITFFKDVISEMLDESKLKKIAEFNSETISLPVYETIYDGKRIGLIQGFVGSAGSAGQLEELIAIGFTKFIVCGGAGVLQKSVQVGHIIVP